MLCQKCNKKVATVFVSTIVNGKNTQTYLCADCAKEFHENMMANTGNMQMPFSIDEILSNMGINEDNLKELFEDLKGVDVEFGIGGFPNDIMQHLNNVARNQLGSQMNNKEKIETVEKADNEVITNNKDIKCDVCNTTFDEYYRFGKLGCSNCYSAFENELKPIIESISGYSEHIGKTPGEQIINDEKTKALEDLRRQFNLAVEEEEYEQAAILRDKILELESDNM